MGTEGKCGFAEVCIWYVGMMWNRKIVALGIKGAVLHLLQLSVWKRS
jgi:hypothetical protein